MSDVWRQIEEFPNYVVSNRGLICNEKTGRLMALSTNQHGVVLVGLMRDGIQYKRAVAPLVAEAFLPRPRSKRFNTLIHCDGNAEHNFVENLLWRPRPFAIAYHAQFRRPYPNRIHSEVEEVESGHVFANSFKAAISNGLLERAVVTSVLNEDYEVFPTRQRFRLSTV